MMDSVKEFSESSGATAAPPVTITCMQNALTLMYYTSITNKCQYPNEFRIVNNADVMSEKYEYNTGRAYKCFFTGMQRNTRSLEYFT